MTANKRVLFASVAMMLTAGAASGAWAQVGSVLEDAQQTSTSNFSRDRSVSVRERPHPGFEAIGISMGAFNAYPRVDVGVEYNDNIYASDVREVDDVVWRVQPSVTVASTWSRHSLQAFAKGTIRRYNDFDTENSEDWAIGANGRLDITRRANISAGVQFASQVEPRTSSSSPRFSVNPIEYTETSTFVAGVQEFNRVKISGRVDLDKFDYDDGLSAGGLVIEQDDRDRTVTNVMGRLDYALSPATALFVQVTGNSRDYRLSPPAVVLSRDSDGLEALVGANFELGAVMRGEIGVGYIQQSYDDPAFDEVDGFGARAQVEWFPTELTTVTLTGSRSVEDSGIAGTSGYLSSNIGAQIDHELMRNVIVSGQVAFGDDDYVGVDREDKRLNANLSATYLINRHVGLTVGYSYLDQTSEGTLVVGGDFTVNKVGASLTLQF